MSTIPIEEAPPSTSNQEEFKFKVVIVGDSGVGKTNLITRFLNDTFNPNSKATVGVELLNKTYLINNELFKIEIWDTAGQERYKSITSAYYKGAKGAMIVYDVTNANSFNNIDKWITEIKEKASKHINLLIIGNKTDLQDQIEINSDSALEKSQTLDIPLMETSALDSTNVQEAFYHLLREMYLSVKEIVDKHKQNEEHNINEEGVYLNTEESKHDKKCCDIFS